MALDQIQVGERVRKELGDVEALAENIEEVGLLNAVVLAPDGTLLAGHRRLEAVRQLGWATVPHHTVSPDVAALMARRVEHDENVYREDFTLEERGRAYMLVLREERQAAAWRHREAAARAGKASGKVRRGRSPSAATGQGEGDAATGSNAWELVPTRSGEEEGDGAAESPVDARGTRTKGAVRAKDLAAKRIGDLGRKTMDRLVEIIKAADDGDAHARADLDRMNARKLTPTGAYRRMEGRQRPEQVGRQAGAGHPDEGAAADATIPPILIPPPEHDADAEAKLRSLAAGLDRLLANGADPYVPLVEYVTEHAAAVSEEVRSRLVRALEKAAGRLQVRAVRMKRSDG